MEEWKTITEFPNYSVSSYGNVRDNRTNKLRKLTSCANGYYYVSLRQNGKYSYKTVHRLVAEAFIPNPYNKPQINHIDGVRGNNNVKNLEWVTAHENNLHAWRVLDSSKRREQMRNSNNPYFGEGHLVTDEGRKAMSVAKKKPLVCVETGKIYECALEASKDSSVGKQCITHACNGRCKTAGGYHWEYIEG